MEINLTHTNVVPEPPKQPRELASKKFIITAVAIVLVVLAAIVTLVFYPGLKKKDVVKAASEVSYFNVVSVSPQDNSDGNASNTPITITFSQPIDPDALRNGYFTVSPMVPGTFSQGATPDDVVFTPKFTFKSGTAVKVILNKGFEAISGARFTSDYSFGFTTEVDDNSVVFGNGDFNSELTSVKPNTDLQFSLEVGNLVDPNGTVTLYKGTTDQLLHSLTYTNQANPGSLYVTQNFTDTAIDTSGFTKISTTQGLSDQGTYDFNQGPGLYYIEAESQGNAVGFTWVNVTDQGLITRQDDQNIYVASQNILTGDTSIPVAVTVYNLENQPTAIGTAMVTGSAEIPVPYPQQADVLIGTTDQGVIIVPLSVPETQSDTRVESNLSQLGTIYFYTDRPTYVAGDTMQFSGIAREDNDGQYTLPSMNSSVRVWIPDPASNTGATFFDQIFPVDQHGAFSGQLVVPQSLAPSASDGTTSVVMHAQLVNDPNKTAAYNSYTTFDVVSGQSNAILRVHFDKPDYTRNESVIAHISGTDASGAPLANQTVTYEEYSKSYYENDPVSMASFGTDWGTESATVDRTVMLDAQGKANVTMDTASDGSPSQSETLAASVTTPQGDVLHGASTVFVQQGTTILSFGASKQNYNPGDTTITRVYATDLHGTIMPNVLLQYDFYYSDYDNSSSTYKETVLAQGMTQTDANGFALIQQPIDYDGGITVRVSTKDNLGNTIQAEQSYFMAPVDGSAGLYYHAPVLANLDVSTDKQHYTVGDTANLVINSPYDQNVFLTEQRGRIYHAEWIHLSQGNNSYAIPITQELAPSFNVSFNYYHNGVINTEGLTILVQDPTKVLAVSAMPDQQSYAPSSSAAFTITTSDAQGNPVSANATAEVINEDVYNLRTILASGDLYSYYFLPRTDTTNFSASSLGVGTGGGCGGGDGDDIQYVPDRLGTTTYWNTSITTGNDGQARINVPLPSTGGTYRVIVRASTDSTAVGETDSTIAVQ